MLHLWNNREQLQPIHTSLPPSSDPERASIFTEKFRDLWIEGIYSTWVTFGIKEFSFNHLRIEEFSVNVVHKYSFLICDNQY